MKNIQELITKWSDTAKIGGMSVESLPEDIKGTMAQLLENIDSYKPTSINEDFANSTSSVGEIGSTASYKPITLAMWRRTLPALFATKTVPTQAMTSPVGLAFALRVIYANNNGLNGPEAAWDQVPIYSGFTGSTSGTSATYSLSAAGSAVSTSTAEAWKMGTDYPQLKLILDKVAIEAKTRKLGASFSLESAQDISALHNIDIQREIVRVLQYELLGELDRELISKLKVTSVSGVGGAAASELNLNATSGTGFVDGRWSQEQISSLVTAIIYQSEKIAIATRRGPANFAVVSPGVATILASARPNFQGIGVNVKPRSEGIAEIGTLNGTITVYRDQYAGTDEYALLGYKGEGNDGGVVFSPYLMNVMNQATDPYDFSPKIGVMSRYALTDSLLGSGRYYRWLKISGISKLIASY